MKEKALIRAAISVIEWHYLRRCGLGKEEKARLDSTVLEHIYQILLTIDDPNFESEDK